MAEQFINGWVNAAAYCGVSVASLRRAVAAGNIKAEKVDGVWQFLPEDLDETPWTTTTRSPTPPSDRWYEGLSGCYFMLKIGSSPLIVKIGWSKNAEHRRETLASVSCPYSIALIAVIPGPVGDEAKLHQMFSKYRVGKEWFKADPVLDWLLSFDYVSKSRLIKCVGEIMERSDVDTAKAIFRTVIQYSLKVRPKVRPASGCYPGRCCPLPRTMS